VLGTGACAAAADVLGTGRCATDADVLETSDPAEDSFPFQKSRIISVQALCSYFDTWFLLLQPVAVMATGLDCAGERLRLLAGIVRNAFAAFAAFAQKVRCAL
jgi:hypothetical protein